MKQNTNHQESNILVVWVIVEKHDSYQNFDFGLPIIAFFNREKALKYKKDRKQRDLKVKRLEIH